MENPGNSTVNGPEGTLAVVAYANRLNWHLPTVVSPILRSGMGLESVCVFPPCGCEKGVPLGAYHGTEFDFNRLRDRGEITILESPIPYQFDHELWVDQERVVHYGPAGQVRETLRLIAIEHIRKAKAALRSGNCEEAERLCAIALSADDRFVESLAIKAAVCWHRGDMAGGRVLLKIASTLITPEGFQHLVNSCLS